MLGFFIAIMLEQWDSNSTGTFSGAKFRITFAPLNIPEQKSINNPLTIFEL